ncbi:MAG TPA: Gfo/Idh/MocA family oxidoreductase [Edaphobacter sp.]|nr:Gfo/Idh/MocA family oxidoreductase [Edaphobacter sp.]
MGQMDRRDFVKTGAAASGLLLLKSKTAFGYEANSAVRMGLLGCGNRGTTVANSFAKYAGARVVALGDIFPDKLAAGKAHFDQLNQSLGQSAIEENLLFHGHDAFQELAHAKGVDMVQISTPPWFHVEHLEAAVNGGKHVYCEKPVGVDVAQAKKALEIASKVKNLSVDVGFEVRSAPPIAAIMEKVRGGALGKIASLSGNYYAPASTEKPVKGPSHDEWRLRNWLWDRALSGDILVEQNIHIIDLCNWVLGAHPLKAMATGGRNILTHPGDCWDNYQVIYTYPNDVHVSFASTQFGKSAFSAGVLIFGAKGMAEAPYAGPIRITGETKWTWQDGSGAPSTITSGTFAANGAFNDNLALADREKTRSFIESITSGRFHNQIADGVESAQSCMLGRMAGYQKREVTWEDLLAHGETYPLGLNLNQFS